MMSRLFKSKLFYNSLLVLPVIVYFFFMRKLYPGELVLTGDGPEYFFHIKHYLDNILQGIYPRWNPFDVWGYPYDLFLRSIGEFNPFLFLIALLNRMGFSFSFSYFLYLIFYFLLGVWGFYCVAHRIFKDSVAAYLAALLLLFSTMGLTFFNDNAVNLLIVPIIWFFYFLRTFTEKPQNRSLAGITFTLMIIVTTYMPFYFAMIFLAFVICFAVIYPQELAGLARKYVQYFRAHIPFGLLCLALILCSLIPGILWFVSGWDRELLVSWRSAGAGSGHVASMALEIIRAGGIVGPFTIKKLFSTLQYAQIGDFYVPLFVYIPILLALSTRISKRMLLFSSWGLILFLISLANATPLHGFLYKFVFFFQYFRNLKYLFWSCLPIGILFSVETFMRFLKHRPQTRWQKTGLIAFLLIVHLGCAAFLLTREDVFGAAYVVLLLSVSFFVLYFWGFARKKSVAMVMLLFIVSIHPFFVFNSIGNNSRSSTIQYDDKPFVAEFLFTRPKRTGGSWEETLKDKLQVFNARDTSGFVGKTYGVVKYIGTTWSYFLHEKMDPDILEDYVSKKFIAYDQVSCLQSEEDWRKIEDAFARKRNIAYISGEEEGKCRQGVFPSGKRDFDENYQVVREGSGELEVLRFDMNSLKIRTSFRQKKFLAYNDSYHSAWRAYLDGKRTRLLRANIAFKGIWVPAGEHVILWEFGSRIRYLYFKFLFLLFGGSMVYLVYSFLKLKNE